MVCESDPSPKRPRHVQGDDVTACSAASAHTFDVDDVQRWLDHYHNEGFVILRDIIDETTRADAKRGLNVLVDELALQLRDQGVVEDVVQHAPFETRLLTLCRDNPERLPNLFRKELHRPELFGIFCHQRLLDAVRRILSDADDIRIFPNYSARPKTRFAVHDVVWHQDAGLRYDGGPSTAPTEERLAAFGPGVTVNCWTPLVPARATNGAMKFVPRSHQRGILPHVRLGTYTGLDGSGKSLESGAAGKYAAGVDPSIMDSMEGSAIDVECDPGDVVLFSNLLVHRGGANTTDQIRWSLDWRFQNAAKPTHRTEQGHVVWSRCGHAVASANDWASLSLS